ncbi:MAG: class I SAM-dependent methyltransferase [Anaerolineae bacterium]|nr:class I SAM-dependent methyltransferase [Anaerolineae bacterium]
MRLLRRLLRRSPRTLSSTDAYEKWADSYAAHAHNPLMAIEEKAMLALSPNLQDKIVLDLACGTGRYAVIAQEQDAAQVVGVDNSLAMLQSAKIAQVGLSTTEALPLATASIDVVLCGLALGHLPQIDDSMREISRVLKPNGIALISDFHPFQYLSGARRTFHAADGKVYNVEHYVHLVADYFRIGQSLGLSMTGILEPSIAGKMPVVLVMRFQKSS